MEGISKSGITASRICKTVAEELRAVAEGVPYRTGFRGSDDFQQLCGILMGVAKERRYFLPGEEANGLTKVYLDWPNVMIREGFNMVLVKEPEVGVEIIW